MTATVLSYWTNVDYLGNEDAFRAAIETLPPARAEKALEFIFHKDRALSIGAWLLLESALRASGVSIDAKELRLNDYGKPFFADGPFFNLSHSGSATMCSISFECAVGCDIEQIRAFDEQLARHCMQHDEVEEMLALPDCERNEAFYRRWTLKESYMKAHGKGLSIPPESFAICCTEHGAPSVRHDNTCSFAEFSCVDGYCLAACTLERTARFAPIVHIELERP